MNIPTHYGSARATQLLRPSPHQVYTRHQIDVFGSRFIMTLVMWPDTMRHQIDVMRMEGAL